MLFFYFLYYLFLLSSLNFCFFFYLFLLLFFLRKIIILTDRLLHNCNWYCASHNFLNKICFLIINFIYYIDIFLCIKNYFRKLCHIFECFFLFYFIISKEGLILIWVLIFNYFSTIIDNIIINIGINIILWLLFVNIIVQFIWERNVWIFQYWNSEINLIISAIIFWFEIRILIYKICVGFIKKRLF